MKKFNLNNYILVEITKYGWEHLSKNYSEDYITHVIKSKMTVIDGVDYYELQAHEVISTFGNPMWIASHSPISSNILIPEEIC